jgi:hypothetical protein
MTGADVENHRRSFFSRSAHVAIGVMVAVGAVASAPAGRFKRITDL